MPGKKQIKALLLGDVYGNPGCRALFMGLPQLIKTYKTDIVVVNGENAADNGFGLAYAQMRRFFDSGVDVITSGNHIWQQEDLMSSLDKEPNLLRPANYPPSVPGHGYTIVNGIGVINLQGRYSMIPLDCPFRAAKSIVEKIKGKTNAILVDFHAESNQEKEALGFWLDGKVSAVVGTHTHVQTADAKILPEKTAYITDLGMCGPLDSVIGSQPSSSVRKQLLQMPFKPVVKEGKAALRGVCITINPENGKAENIEVINQEFGF
ncbi:MAG: TIGR00282 family metallophosphoesterase [Sphaerochaetaceae bacterium]